MARTLDEVRALFADGAVLECIENTYIPARNGKRITITRAGKTVCDAEMDGKPYRCSLPARAGDVIRVDRESVTYLLDSKLPRLAGHTVTWAKVRDCYGECGATIAATPGNYYCDSCIDAEREAQNAEREAFDAFHAFADRV